MQTGESIMHYLEHLQNVETFRMSVRARKIRIHLGTSALRLPYHVVSCFSIKQTIEFFIGLVGGVIHFTRHNQTSFWIKQRSDFAILH